MVDDPLPISGIERAGDGNPSPEATRRGCGWRAWALLAAVVVLGGGAATASLAVRAGRGGALMRGPVGQAMLRLSADDLAAPGSDPTVLTFTVVAGEPVQDIASRMAAIGLVRDADAFVLLAKVTGGDRLIQAGDHALATNMTAADVLEALATAQGTDVSVTLPEGLRAEEVADILSATGLVDRAAFLALAADPATAVPGAVDVPGIVAARTGPSLEGYLYPDTYRFDPAAGAEAVLVKLLATFAERVPADLDARAKAVGLAGGHEAVILASIVQREGVKADELPRIARVYINRLAEPPYILNADPTLQYALGFQSDPLPGTWWKRPLYDTDKQVVSPYNSYQLPGLPPGPIASPGLAAITAVVAPADGPWMFFVASAACDGTHVFAVTYEEHLANVERYVAGGCGG